MHCNSPYLCPMVEVASQALLTIQEKGLDSAVPLRIDESYNVFDYTYEYSLLLARQGVDQVMPYEIAQSMEDLYVTIKSFSHLDKVEVYHFVWLSSSYSRMSRYDLGGSLKLAPFANWVILPVYKLATGCHFGKPLQC